MSKQKKCKIATLILIFVLGTIGSIYFSVYLHVLLSKGKIDINIFKFENLIRIIKNNQNALKLFGCFELLVIMASIFQYFSSDKAYQSDLIKVTPQILTPVAAGQKQFGSARWMTEKEKDKAFDVVKIKKDKLINDLIEHGYDDVKNLKEGDKNN